MKKVLALILAGALAVGSATVAFAAQTTTMQGYTLSGLFRSSSNTTMDLYPDEVYNMYVDSGEAVTLPATIDTKIYSISAKWTKGGAMIKSVTIDNDKDAIKITTNANYTLEDAKDIIGTITLTLKTDVTNNAKAVVANKGDKFVFNINGWNMTNDSITVVPYDNWDDARNDPLWTSNHTVYTTDGAGKLVINSESSLLQIEASVKDNQKIFMQLDEKTVYDVIDLLDEKNIEYNDLAFYNAKGKFAFSNGRAEAIINSDFEKKPYLYTWNGTALTAVNNATWNDSEGTYTIPMTGPTQYVLSDVQLKNVTGGTTTDNTTGTITNPDTGANDFVGLAVALAVVSVAGIAVAKKR